MRHPLLSSRFFVRVFFFHSKSRETLPTAVQCAATNSCVHMRSNFRQDIRSSGLCDLSLLEVDHECETVRRNVTVFVGPVCMAWLGQVTQGNGSGIGTILNTFEEVHVPI